ncbi:hypothetical protein Tco_1482380 [Tanacetum coccineum]
MTTPPPAEIVQEKSIQTSMSGNKNEPSPSTKGTKEALQAMAEERKKKEKESHNIERAKERETIEPCLIRWLLCSRGIFDTDLILAWEVPEGDIACRSLQVKITWATTFLKLFCKEVDLLSSGYRKSFLVLSFKKEARFCKGFDFKELCASPSAASKVSPTICSETSSSRVWSTSLLLGFQDLVLIGITATKFSF